MNKFPQKSGYDFLYKVIYEMTNVFESSKTPNELILGLKQVFKRFFGIVEIEFFIKDDNSTSFKNFVKPWENLPEDNMYKSLTSVFSKFKNGDKTHIFENGEIYFPLFKQGKINGIAKLSGSMEEDLLNTFAPLLIRQISLAVVHMNYFETVKNSAKFYETIKNITKITETQYDLNYIIPIMGEMIDGFIREHLIYIFLKNKRKKEYRLVWPNKCLINNISEYLSKLKDGNFLLFDNGKTCIFPLMADNKTIGAIVAYNPLDSLNKNDIEYMEQLTIQASVTVNKAKEYMKVLENATLDALTGLNNRAMFYQRLNETTSNAKRQNSDLCCIMTDIDFFKSVNDTYGHAVGDLVLKTTAKTIKKELREYDIASRFGGEEFTILLPDTPLDEAEKVGQRLRRSIEKKKVNIESYNIDNIKEISVTISIGISKYDSNTMKDPAELYQKADKGLYIAKESGRNRVVVFDNL